MQDKTYVVVTTGGYWGRAKTLIKACKNAYIGTDKVTAHVYVTVDHLYSETHVDGMGTYGATFTEEFMDCLAVDSPSKATRFGALAIKNAVFDASQWGRFTIKITSRGKLIMEQEQEEE